VRTRAGVVLLVVGGLVTLVGIGLVALAIVNTAIDGGDDGTDPMLAGIVVGVVGVVLVLVGLRRRRDHRDDTTGDAPRL